MNFRRLYLIIFVLSSVGFNAQNCFSVDEEKATSVGQEAKLFGDVAKKFATEKTAQARRLASKTGTSISNGAGRAWSWFGEKCSWAKAKTASGFENLKKTSTEKGQAAKKWFDKNSPVAKEKAKQSWKKIKSSTSSAKDRTLVSLNVGRKWSSEKAKLFWLLAKKSTEQKMASTRAWTESKYDKSKKTWQALETGEKCAWVGTFLAVTTLLGVVIGSFIKKDKPLVVPDPVPSEEEFVLPENFDLFYLPPGYLPPVPLEDPAPDMSLSVPAPRRNDAGDFLVTGEEFLRLRARIKPGQGVVLPEDIVGQLRAAWARSDFMTTEFVLPERLVSSIVQMNPTLLVPEGRLPERPAITFGPMPEPAAVSAPVGPPPAIEITPLVAEEVFAAPGEGESVFHVAEVPYIEQIDASIHEDLNLENYSDSEDGSGDYKWKCVCGYYSIGGRKKCDSCQALRPSTIIDMTKLQKSFFDDPDYSKEAQETGWEALVPNISMPSLFSFVPTAITSRLSEFPWFGQKKQDPAAERPVLTANPNLSSSSSSSPVVELPSNPQAHEIPVFVGIEPKPLGADAQQEFALIKLRKKIFNVPVFSSSMQVPANIEDGKLVLIKNSSADPCLLRMRGHDEPLVIKSEEWQDRGHYLDIDIQNTRQRVQVVSEQEFDDFQPSQDGAQLLMKREPSDDKKFRLFKVERLSDCDTSSAEINLEEWNFAPKHSGFLDFVFVGQEKSDQGAAFVFDRGNFVSLDPAYLEQGRPTFVMLRKPSKNIQGSFDHQLFMVEKGEDGQTQEWTPIEAGKWNFPAELESGSPVSQEDEATELRSENEPTDQSNAAFSELVPVALTNPVNPSESLAAINLEFSPESFPLPPSPLSSVVPEIPVANHQDSGVEPSSVSQSLPLATQEIEEKQQAPGALSWTSWFRTTIPGVDATINKGAYGLKVAIESLVGAKNAVIKKVLPHDESGSVVVTAPDFSLNDAIQRRKASSGSRGSISPTGQGNLVAELASVPNNLSPVSTVAKEALPAVVLAESKSDQGNVAAAVEPAKEPEIPVNLSEGIISVRLPEPISNPLDLIISGNAVNQTSTEWPIEPVVQEEKSDQKNRPAAVKPQKVRHKPASKNTSKLIQKTKAEEFGIPTGENRPQPIPKIGDKSKKPASRSKKNGNPSQIHRLLNQP